LRLEQTPPQPLLTPLRLPRTSLRLVRLHWRLTLNHLEQESRVMMLLIQRLRHLMTRMMRRGLGMVMSLEVGMLRLGSSPQLEH